MDGPTTCLGKSYSFGLPRVPSIYVFIYFPFGFKDRIWDMGSFYFSSQAIAIKWATPWENVYSGVSDQARHKPACTATEAS